MAQSFSIFLVRAATILLAGMLLSAIFTGARAQNMNGYGVQPAGSSNTAPPSYLYSPAAAANNSYDAAPVSGGYYAPMPVSGNVGAPLANAPISNGFEPAPAGYVSAPPLSPPSYATQQPVSQAPAPQTSPYGYRSGDGVPLPLRSMASDAAQPQQAEQKPYGFRPGDGVPLPQQQPVYQQPVQNQQPAQTAQPNPYGYRPGDGVPLSPQPVQQQPVQQQPAQQQLGQSQEQPQTAQPYGYRAGDGAPPQPQNIAAAQQPAAPDRDYVLGNGDKLRLTVFEEVDLSGEYTIDGSGYLRLPLVGQVRAAGFTSAQLEGAIANALSQGYLKSPRVSVQVATYRPFYIIGAVTKPGEYPYVHHMNALNAIALAGGFTPGAVESVIYIRREGSNTEERLPTDRSTQVNPGDVVRVNNTFFAEAMSLLSPLSTPLSIAAAAAVP
jgi:polysaccharide export outer membrane protein